MFMVSWPAYGCHRMKSLHIEHQSPRACPTSTLALTSKLVLDRRPERRTVLETVHRQLARELRVKVRHVHGALYTRLERRLDLLLRELDEVDVVLEERVLLDLVCALDAEPPCWVARDQPGEDRARLRGDFVSEGKRVLWPNKLEEGEEVEG